MKSWLIALSMAVGATSLGVFSVDAEARRLGGARPSGMQRQLPPRQPDATPQSPAQQTAPTQNSTAPTAQAAPAGTAAAAAGAAPRRSWMGPIAGLAAGIGLAALFSHLGLSGALANFVMAMLLVLAVVLVLRFVLRRFAGNAAANRQPQFAGMGGHAGHDADRFSPAASPGFERSALQPAASSAPATASALPAGMDAQDFERVAKMLFIRLQASNDAGEIDDLRRFTTPELFASLRLDLQDRAGKPQRTDVVQLDAQLVDTVEQEGHAIASVRFSGLIREEGDGPPQAFAELWHLVRPTDGSSEWRIAGITPEQA